MKKIILFSFIFVWLLVFLHYRTSPNFNKPQSSPITPTVMPTPTETKWQTYKNTLVNYSIDYDYSIKINNDASPVSKDIQFSSQSQDGNKLSSIDIKVVNIPIYVQQEQIFDRQIGNSIAKCQNIKTNYRECWLKIPNKQLYLDFSLYLGVDNIYDRAIDQVFSTFKFLPDNTTWKTYADADGFLSFRYPNSWPDAKVIPQSTRQEILIEDHLDIVDGSYFDQEKYRSKTFKEYIQEQESVLKNIKPDVYKLGSFKGIRYADTDSSGRTYINIILSDSDTSSRIFSASYISNSEVSEANRFFDTILSTFKFGGATRGSK